MLAGQTDDASTNKPCVQPQRGAKLAVEMSKSGLILSHTLQFFNLTFIPFSTSWLPNPPVFSLASLYISCDIGLKSESLPGSSGMLTQQPPSACFHSQMEKALS